jgi:cell wall-associated NlpC family hydrolase
MATLMRLRITRHLLFSLLLFALVGCSAAPKPAPPTSPPEVPADPIGSLLETADDLESQSNRPLEEMKFSVQVGAFSQLENAVRLEQALKEQGVDAYYFRDESGLYKVRFGNHDNYQAARSEAETFQRQGVIGRFFIVIPGQYAAARIKQSGRGDLRSELVSTVQRYLGIPYRWGGETTQGFDCSGLTMVCYRINGLNLPRNSRSQYQAGRPVARQNLQAGDLVFFATKGGTRVTHVGMYIGDGKFIHAPRTGKTVRVAELSNAFFVKTYIGARSYL